MVVWPLSGVGGVPHLLQLPPPSRPPRPSPPPPSRPPLLFDLYFLPIPFFHQQKFPHSTCPILIVNCTKFLACALQSLTNNFRYIHKLCDEKTNNVPFPEHGILGETCQPDPKDWRNADWSLHCTGRPSCGKLQVKSNPI